MTFVLISGSGTSKIDFKQQIVLQFQYRIFNSTKIFLEEPESKHTLCWPNKFLKITTIKPGGDKMAKVNKINISSIETILPPEIIEKILKLLTYIEICQAKLICRRWNEVIIKGKLVKKVSRKILHILCLYLLKR